MSRLRDQLRRMNVTLVDEEDLAPIRQMLRKADDAPGGERKSAPLRRYWTHGEGAAKIAWGAPGDFDRCVVQVSKYMEPEQAKGYCNERHHDALGIYPATHAKMVNAAKGKK